MSDFLGFKDSYIKSEPHSSLNSGAVSSVDLLSPPLGNTLARQKSLNIQSQSIKNETLDFHPRSLDIKKQLSLSFQSNTHGGGVTKPQPRKNSAYNIKSNGGSNDESDGEQDGNSGEDQGHERKRRDNINDKIQELLGLVPQEFFDESRNPKQGASENPNGNQLEQDAAIAAAVKGSGTKDGKPNKGQILTQSVEYIQHLQNLIDENNRKEVELTLMYKRLQNRVAQRNTNIPVKVGHTSAEKCLGEIGVGPLSEEYFKKVLRNNAKRSSVGSF